MLRAAERLLLFSDHFSMKAHGENPIDELFQIFGKSKKNELSKQVPDDQFYSVD